MNQTLRTFHLVTLAIALVLLAATWLLLAPPVLGGRTSFVIVNGNSMEPVYVRGDLVLVRAAETYNVGDIATYRHPQIGPVIHRIIGRSGDRWQFKGDHNSFVDPYQPRDADLIGRAVLHVPFVGGLLVAARNPVVIVVLAVGAGVLFMQRSQPRSRLRRNQPRGAAFGLRVGPNAGLFGSAALIAFAALGLSVWALLQPLQRAQTEEISYTHTGAFSYRAAAPNGIYDGDSATTGEPIFWQLSNQLDVAFDYELKADAPTTIEGSAQLDATLSSADGWRRTLALSQLQPFDGKVPTLRGSVDLDQIRTLIDSLETRAGLPRREYLLTISPHIQIDGSVNGETLQDTFSPKLVFRSDEFQLSLVRDDEQDSLLPVKAAILKHETLVEQRLFPNVPLTVGTARLAAPIVLVLALVVAGVCGFPLLHDLRRNETARIRLRYGGLLADATPIATQSRIEIVVADIDTLARIAERQGALMLHDTTAFPPRYLVCNGDTMYTYRSTTAAQPLPISSTETQAFSGAPQELQSDWHTVFLQELRSRGLASEACRIAGVALAEAYREREHNTGFARAWDRARTASLNQGGSAI